MARSALRRAPQRKSSAAAEKTSYHHGNLQPELIGVGLELLEQQGAAQLSLRSLARRLGVSQTAPYHHFADKNALLAALAAEGFRKLARNLEASPLHKLSFERRISGLCGGLVRFARENPQLFRIMYQGHIRNTQDYPDLVDAAAHSYDMLVKRVRETLDEAAVAHIDVDHAAMAIFAMGFGMASFVLDRRISPRVVQVIGDGRAFVRAVSSLLATGFKEPGKA